MMTFVGFCFLVVVGYGVYYLVQKKRLEGAEAPKAKHPDPRVPTGGSGGGSKDD
jgi:hypothetical protein